LYSGYGAGLTSPGWYRHLWKNPNDLGVKWLTKVAQLFRKKKLDISTAHVIEAVRLAESIAALRDYSRPGLAEMQEATQTVMCMGDAVLLELIKKDLVVGVALGKVPDDLPKLPLQADFEENCRKLKLAMTSEIKTLELDLRKDYDLQRSIFLNRLQILGINWAKTTHKRSKGTFKEVWNLKWEPEMMIQLIEKGILGNRVEDACSAQLLAKANETNSVGDLSNLINLAIPAELFVAIDALLQKINNAATLSTDLIELMQAIAPLADIGRYGNVRSTDMTDVQQLVSSLILRVCIGLHNACYGLDDDASLAMFGYIRKVHDAVQLLDNEGLKGEWFAALEKVSDKTGIHPVLQGCAIRLLFDVKILDAETTSIRFGLALSTANEPTQSAAWLEGFMKGSGLILLYDAVLWNLLYQWVSGLTAQAFTDLLPVLRRTFSKFETGERKQLGAKAKQGLAIGVQNYNANDEGIEGFDTELAAKPLELISLLLGLSKKNIQ
jgi:hypothetical protein